MAAAKEVRASVVEETLRSWRTLPPDKREQVLATLRHAANDAIHRAQAPRPIGLDGLAAELSSTRDSVLHAPDSALPAIMDALRADGKNVYVVHDENSAQAALGDSRGGRDGPHRPLRRLLEDPRGVVVVAWNELSESGSAARMNSLMEPARRLLGRPVGATLPVMHVMGPGSGRYADVSDRAQQVRRHYRLAMGGPPPGAPSLPGESGAGASYRHDLRWGTWRTDELLVETAMRQTRLARETTALGRAVDGLAGRDIEVILDNPPPQAAPADRDALALEVRNALYGQERGPRSVHVVLRETPTLSAAEARNTYISGQVPDASSPHVIHSVADLDVYLHGNYQVLHGQLQHVPPAAHPAGRALHLRSALPPSKWQELDAATHAARQTVYLSPQALESLRAAAPGIAARVMAPPHAVAATTAQATRAQDSPPQAPAAAPSALTSATPSAPAPARPNIIAITCPTADMDAAIKRICQAHATEVRILPMTPASGEETFVERVELQPAQDGEDALAATIRHLPLGSGFRDPDSVTVLTDVRPGTRAAEYLDSMRQAGYAYTRDGATPGADEHGRMQPKGTIYVLTAAASPPMPAAAAPGTDADASSAAGPREALLAGPHAWGRAQAVGDPHPQPQGTYFGWNQVSAWARSTPASGDPAGIVLWIDLDDPGSDGAQLEYLPMFRGLRAPRPSLWLDGEPEAIPLTRQHQVIYYTRAAEPAPRAAEFLQGIPRHTVQAEPRYRAAPTVGKPVGEVPGVVMTPGDSTHAWLGKVAAAMEAHRGASAAHKPGVVIEGPVGRGKTTTVEAWLRSTGHTEAQPGSPTQAGLRYWKLAATSSALEIEAAFQAAAQSGGVVVFDELNMSLHQGTVMQQLHAASGGGAGGPGGAFLIATQNDAAQLRGRQSLMPGLQDHLQQVDLPQYTRAELVAIAGQRPGAPLVGPHTLEALAEQYPALRPLQGAVDRLAGDPDAKNIEAALRLAASPPPLPPIPPLAPPQVSQAARLGVLDRFGKAARGIFAAPAKPAEPDPLVEAGESSLDLSDATQDYSKQLRTFPGVTLDAERGHVYNQVNVNGDELLIREMRGAWQPHAAQPLGLVRGQAGWFEGRSAEPRRPGWAVVPGAGPDDELAVEAGVQAKRNAATGQYLVRHEGASFSYAVRPGGAAPQPLPRITHEIPPDLFARYPTLNGWDLALASLAADPQGQRAAFNEILKSIADFDGDITGKVPGNGTPLERFLTMCEQGVGACRHRAQLAVLLGAKHGIPTRMITNAVHAYIEWQPGHEPAGARWKQQNLGGSGNYIAAPQDAEPGLSLPRFDRAPAAAGPETAAHQAARFAEAAKAQSHAAAQRVRTCLDDAAEPRSDASRTSSLQREWQAVAAAGSPVLRYWFQHWTRELFIPSLTTRLKTADTESLAPWFADMLKVNGKAGFAPRTQPPPTSEIRPGTSLGQLIRPTEVVRPVTVPCSTGELSFRGGMPAFQRTEYRKRPERPPNIVIRVSDACGIHEMLEWYLPALKEELATGTGIFLQRPDGGCVRLSPEVVEGLRGAEDIHRASRRRNPSTALSLLAYPEKGPGTDSAALLVLSNEGLQQMPLATGPYVLSDDDVTAITNGDPDREIGFRVRSRRGYYSVPILPIELAAAAGREDLVRAQLGKGAKAGLGAALEAAVNSGHFDVAELLLRTGVPLGTISEHIIQIALMDCKFHTIEFLLNAGGADSVRAQASYCAHPRMLEFLCARGVLEPTHAALTRHGVGSGLIEALIPREPPGTRLSAMPKTTPPWPASTGPPAARPASFAGGQDARAMQP